MKKKLLALICLLAMAIMLVACGKSKNTLEAFYSEPSRMAQVEAQLAQQTQMYSAFYSDIKIEYHDNSIKYIYLYQPDAIIPETIDGEALKASIPTIKESIKAESGIEPESIGFYYYDASGNLVWGNDYK